MDIYTKTVITSWIELILTVTAAILAVILAVKAAKYIRAVLRRISFMRRLKSECLRSGTELTILSSPYRSVFRPSDTSELLLKTSDKLYSLKFFPCIHNKDTYQFDAEGNYHRISNYKPLFLNHRYYTFGTAGNKTIKKVLLPNMLRHNDTFFKKSGCTNFNHSDIEGAIPILCLNPVPADVIKVSGNGTVRVFDGDELCGYRVYSAAGILGKNGLLNSTEK